MIDWTSCPAVERDPERVSGAWVFRGTRVPVTALFQNRRGWSATLVLSTTSWPRVELAANQINQAVQAAAPGSFSELSVPWKRNLTMCFNRRFGAARQSFLGSAALGVAEHGVGRHRGWAV